MGAVMWVVMGLMMGGMLVGGGVAMWRRWRDR
jgi:hypothetical protein